MTLEPALVAALNPPDALEVLHVCVVHAPAYYAMQAALDLCDGR